MRTTTKWRGGRPRLLLVTQYYHPEVGAPQTRLRETVTGLRKLGFQVTVVAAIPSYPLGVVPHGYSRWRPRRERIDGVSVVRLPTLVIRGSGMARRMAGYVTFGAASLACVAMARRFDVALIESPPLLLGIAGRALRAAGLPYVFHVADPWPDFPIALGYLRSGIERRLAYALEDLAYRGAARITTVSPGLVELLAAKPSAGGKVRLLPNGVDLGGFDAELPPPIARRRLGWDECFTVVYVGTVGRAQGIGTLLDAARLLDEDIRIRIVGDGAEREELEIRALAMGLSTVSFHAAVPRTRVPEVLAAAEAGLVMLRRGPLFDDSLPTKLLETMAARRPVIVSAGGLAARVARESGGGYVARAEDSVDLARAIAECRADPGRHDRGGAARAHVTARYERGAIVRRLAGYLEEAATTR